MPAATVYSSNEIQKPMKKVQKRIVGIFEVLYSPKRSIWQLIEVACWALQTIMEVRKFPPPSHGNVNKYNSHTMIDLRDWVREHQAPDEGDSNFYTQGRARVIDTILNFVIMKYEVDSFMGKRFDKWLEKWYEKVQTGEWVFTHKHPETSWILNEEDKKEPTYIRQQALQEALNGKEWSKVLQLID